MPLHTHQFVHEGVLHYPLRRRESSRQTSRHRFGLERTEPRSKSRLPLIYLLVTSTWWWPAWRLSLVDYFARPSLLVRS